MNLKRGPPQSRLSGPNVQNNAEAADARLKSRKISNDDIRGGIADRLEAIACAIYPDAAGSPRETNGDEIRIGNNGSLSLIVRGPDKGLWFDHEADAGGGPMELVAEAYGIPRQGAFGQLRETCLDVLGWRDGETLPPQQPKKTAAEIERDDAERKAKALQRASAARQIILQSVKPTGDGAAYLTSRGLPVDAPNVLWMPNPLNLPFKAEIRAYMQAEGTTGAIVMVARTREGDARAVQCIIIGAGGRPILEPEKPGKKRRKLKRTLGAVRDAKNPAVFRLPGPDDRPLVLTDGPEDALSAYSAGYQAWAALGSAYKNMDPEAGRALAVFADNDGADSKAQASLDKAATHFTDKGHPVAIARAPEPHKDANDLLQAEGREAVATAIDSAMPWTPPGDGLPPYRPARRPVRAEALYANHVAIMEGVKAEYAADAIYQANRDYRDRYNDERTARGLIGPMFKADRQKAAERFRSEVSALTGIPEKDLKLRGCAQGRLLLVVSDVAAGKSYTVAKAIRLHGRGLVTWLLVPTNEKAREAVAEFNQDSAPDHPLALFWPGYGATMEPERRNEPGKRYCQRPDAMDAALRAGVENIGQSMCDDGKGSRCPYASTCPLLKARRAAREAADSDNGALIVMAHANATGSTGAPQTGLIVIDEDIVGEATESQFLTFENMGRIDWQNGGDAGLINDQITAWEAVEPLAEAIKAKPGSVGLMDRIRAVVMREQIEAMRDALKVKAKRAAALIKPGMYEASILEYLEGERPSPTAQQRAFLEVLLDQWEGGPDSPRIKHIPERRNDDGDPLAAGVKFYARRKIRKSRSGGLLMLDATGNPERIAEALDVDAADIDVINTRTRLPVLHTEITGRSFAKSEVTKAKNLASKIALFIEGIGGPNAFVATAKSVEQTLRDALPPGMAIAHHGAMRGLNSHAGSPAAFLVSREEPTPWTVEAAVATRHGKQASTLNLIGDRRDAENQPFGYEPQPRRIEGDRSPGVVKTVNALPDPATDRELAAIRDDALTQAAGRVRYVRQARMVFSMTGTGALGGNECAPDLPTGFRLDADDAWILGPFAAIARRNGGALVLSKKGLTETDSKLFGTPSRNLNALDDMADRWPLGGGRSLYIPNKRSAPPYDPKAERRIEAIRRTLAAYGFGVVMQKASGGARVVLLTPDADPETARQAMGAKPKHWRVVIEPSPMPPVLEVLCAEIEADDRAWMNANADKCEAAGFTFVPEIKRIQASDYGGLDMAAPGDSSADDSQAQAPAIPLKQLQSK